VLTKTWARDPATARARSRPLPAANSAPLHRRLPHALPHEGDWTDRYKGVMDVLSEAKEKGIIPRSRLFLPQHRSASRRH